MNYFNLGTFHVKRNYAQITISYSKDQITGVMVMSMRSALLFRHKRERQSTKSYMLIHRIQWAI